MEVLVRGHPRDAKKVPVTGAARLRECKNTEFVLELRKTGLRGRPFVELFALQESVRSESFHCTLDSFFYQSHMICSVQLVWVLFSFERVQCTLVLLNFLLVIL